MAAKRAAADKAAAMERAKTAHSIALSESEAQWQVQAAMRQGDALLQARAQDASTLDAMRLRHQEAMQEQERLWQRQADQEYEAELQRLQDKHRADLAAQSQGWQSHAHAEHVAGLQAAQVSAWAHPSIGRAAPSVASRTPAAPRPAATVRGRRV